MVLKDQDFTDKVRTYVDRSGKQDFRMEWLHVATKNKLYREQYIT
jgi:hypothetical protein